MGSFLAQARDEAPEGDPRTASFRDERPEIQRLFELALEAGLPRVRELKSWEPARLNERHLSMVMMRAGGLKQRTIAQAFDVTDSNASIILNHPDAEYLLSRLQAMKATHSTSIEDRLKALTEPALGSLEAVFDDRREPEEVKAAFKRAPLAFKVLDMNGYGKKQEVAHKHEHRVQLEGTAPQLANLAAALRESREIPETDYEVLEDSGEVQRRLGEGVAEQSTATVPIITAIVPVDTAAERSDATASINTPVSLAEAQREASPQAEPPSVSGGEPPASPPSELPGLPGAGVPSISDSQILGEGLRPEGLRP